MTHSTEHNIKDTIRADAADSAMVASILTVVMTLIEVPIVAVYLVARWVLSFLGCWAGMLLGRGVLWAVKRAIASFRK